MGIYVAPLHVQNSDTRQAPALFFDGAIAGSALIMTIPRLPANENRKCAEWTRRVHRETDEAPSGPFGRPG